MIIYEIGTGYTSIPAQIGAATEIVVEELTKSMQKMNLQVGLIDIAAAERAENILPIIEVKVPKKFIATDVELGMMHKIKRVVYSISLAQTLKKLVRDEKEKVILHFHNQYNLFFFLKMSSKKLHEKVYIAYTNHSYIWHGNWEEIEDTIKKKYFQEVYCIEHADRVFVLNERTRTNLLEHLKVNPNKICLIDNGVNVDIYKMLDEEKKHQLKCDKGVLGKKVFIQVGSVCERKNQLGALQMLLPLMKRDKDIVFCYAGGIISPEYKYEMEDYAKKNGISDRLFYAGELQPGKQLNEFYNLAEAMIFPSKAEGFSLVIIEAMSAGVPVIISDNLQFKLSSDCLKFRDQQDFEQLVEKEIFNEEKHAVLSKRVRESVVNNYSWDKITNDYIKEFVQ